MADELPPSRFGAGYSYGEPPEEPYRYDPREEEPAPWGSPPREPGNRQPWLWAGIAVVLAVAVAVGLIVFIAGREDSPPNAAAPAPVEMSVPTMVILDASGSMTADDAPGPRIDAAKRAIHGLIDALPDQTTIGLTTYGSGTGSTEAEKAAGCQDVTTRIPLGPLNRDSMAAQVDALVPSGYTPISLALTRAADQLPAGDSDQAIVLVSDGEDTCDVPPCDTAAQLKSARPGLTISTVGFTTDGPASEQLACIAAATGGLFVGAANADQLASRLIAVQNIDLAKRSLTDQGINNITLGQSIDEIRSIDPDFPDGDRQGEVTIVYIDCDFGFVDGVLDSIAPHDGGRTIDGVTPGTDVTRATELYGEPVSVDTATATVIYRADPVNDQGDNGYRVEVDRLGGSAGPVTGTIRSIVLCRCAPPAPNMWTDPVVIVTPNSVGAAKLGMSDAEIEQVAGVRLAMSCTQCDDVPTAQLPGDYYAYFTSSGLDNASPDWRFHQLRVGLPWDQTPIGQSIITDEGFRLGDSVDELRRIYGDRLRPYEALGLNSVRGYVLAGDGGYLVFNAIDRDGVLVHEFLVTQKIFS